jgi:hypothetical protein
VRLRSTSRATVRASAAERAIGFSTSSGRPARAARTQSPGRSSVGAQMITACARLIAVSARETAAPEMATGIADGSASQAATRRS